MDDFRTALAAELATAHLSQARASTLVGCSQSVMNQYLSGRRSPSIDGWIKLVRVFPRLVFVLIATIGEQAGRDA